MEPIGELFGFPVYTSPDYPPGEVAIIAIGGAGMEVCIEGGLVVIRARVAAVAVKASIEEQKDLFKGQ